MKTIKICPECGLTFEATNGMQKFCKRKHFRQCVICGSKFEITSYHLGAKDAKTTCSRKCASILRKQTNLERYGGIAPACSAEVQKKMEATTLARFGVPHAAQSKDIQDKMSKTIQDKYGAAWYTQTPEGRADIVKSWQDAQSKQARLDKIAETNLARYGTASSLGNAEVRDKARQTYFNHTGYYEPFANPEVQSKIEHTNMDRYQVNRPLQNEEIREQWRTTNLERYGYENPMQAENVQAKVRATCLARYGNTCFLQSDLGRTLTESSMMSKYNRRWFSQTESWMLSRMLDPTKLSEFLEFKENPKHYITTKYDEKPNIRILAADLGVHENTIGQLIISYQLQDSVTYVYSYMENEVYNFLRSISPDMVIERNTHRVISPLELDIYLPEYQLGIECNPTSTHNSTINAFSATEAPTPYNYHLNKTVKCENANIFLFHIFGSEWAYSRPIIESMLRNLLNKNERVIYARKCDIRELSASDTMEFLNANHRQGGVQSKIRLGLYFEGELVSVMTFGKMRNTIGTGNDDLSDCYELVRFCSLLNTSVIGGASKLFKHFIRIYQPNRIRSFSDRAHTKGTLYEKLGFTKIRESDPGYVWVDSRTDISYHRYSAQKRNIQQFLHDDTIDLNKTEKQIMEEHGFVQVYDSGTITWEWKLDTN